MQRVHSPAAAPTVVIRLALEQRGPVVEIVGCARLPDYDRVWFEGQPEALRLIRAATALEREARAA